MACATRPEQHADARFFSDAKFAAPAERIRAEDVFALSPAMKRYLEHDIADKLRRGGRQQGLVDALYSKGELRLEYDSAMTRNAAQAFEARSGNCLSLVIMTAAFAKELGLAVNYQSLYTDETWPAAATSTSSSTTSTSAWAGGSARCARRRALPGGADGRLPAAAGLEQAARAPAVREAR